MFKKPARDGDLNFIERRKQWRSDLDKRSSKSLMLTVLPAIIMCLFVVLAAPYIHKMTLAILGDLSEDREIRLIETAEEEVPIEKRVPPPDADRAIAEYYQKLYEEQGFDWEATPVLEEPAMAKEAEREIVIRPIEVELLPGPPADVEPEP